MSRVDSIRFSKNNSNLNSEIIVQNNEVMVFNQISYINIFIFLGSVQNNQLFGSKCICHQKDDCPGYLLPKAMF